jgi:hypothetical protein
MPARVFFGPEGYFWRTRQGRGSWIVSFQASRMPTFDYKPLQVKIYVLPPAVLDNAFKYTEAPGEVAVVGAVTHEDENAAIMHISVRDTGVGIAPTTLDVIFSDFLQGEYQGKTKVGDLRRCFQGGPPF